MKAAVLHNYGQDLKVQDVELQEPQKGEVRVKMKAAGICHSDQHVIDAHLPLPVPIVLGHEGAGVVDAVGEGVTGVQQGDHVALNWVPSCGKCHYCRIGRTDVCDEASKISMMATMLDGTTRFSVDGKNVHQFPSTGTFSEYTIVPENSAVPISKDVPFELAALVGCCVITGVGAVMNTAKVEPGSTVAVIGAGGVGFNVIQGAALAGAKQVIAIDMLDEKLEMTKQFGATHTINAKDGDSVGAVLSLTERLGVDYAFEVIGRPETIQNAYNMTKKTGMAVVVGISAPNESVSVNAFSLPNQAKTLAGSWLGQGNPHVDYPKLLDLNAAGKLELEALVSQTFTLDEVNEGLAALRAGKNIRGVIRFD
ncbi:Zn-dependent alcohol dehydrogenase [Salicibibacter kimchii]|uniref:Alcohol dehydrogenase n=1 Tax=Salicibibacter kimchii TaxID=2099786 RepID=A0A345C105_9BACI|nr:Zn-dependent alcohol dehydrogenase [Salicibibacter kimchii]AXF56886.1 alcohol dehydrogenase [Salicibibacter kimchii]